MKLKNAKMILVYLKQLLLMVALIYAFSNCHVKKSILHFAGIGSVELAQKSLTQLPVQGSCTVSLLHKNVLSRKVIAAPQTPAVFKSGYFDCQTKAITVCNTVQIHPAFEFNKSSIGYPPIFIVFKKLKIDIAVIS